MRVAVVDGYSSGAHLVRELLDRGAECVHVRSQPTMHPYYEATFSPSDYVVDLGHDPKPSLVAARLDRLGVERVIVGTESGVALVDELTQLSGLPGNTYELRQARRTKFGMAEALRTAGLGHPRSALVRSTAEAAGWYAKSGLDSVVVKPDASAGSDHVRVCGGERELIRAVAEVLASRNLFGHRNEVALVQECLNGPEYFVNTVSVDGTHTVVETWRYSKTRTAEGAPIFDYEEPADLRSPVVQGLHDYVRRALTALGVRNGAGHSEVVLTERGPILIDPGARLGGGVLPWVSTKLAGHSHAGLYAASILTPNELTSAALPLRWSQPIRYVSLINRTVGRSRTFSWSKRISELPTTLAVASIAAEGTSLRPTTDLMTSPGFVYLHGRSREAIDADYRTIRQWEQDRLYTT
jgi:biotin carboxylase